MFDRIKLKDILTAYKQHFISKQWGDEKYKWEAVKWFQDNWDVNAPDFAEMLNRSLDKTFNLLASNNNFPKGMIVGFAKSAPEEVRAMFIVLFDESKDVFERLDAFKMQSSILLEKYGNGAAQHYQYENAISTYLWLRYPDKYYIYKFGEVKTVASELEADYRFKKGSYADNLRNFLKFYDEISMALKEDNELVRLFQSQLDETCYPDPELKTLTIDVGFYISRYYSERENDDSEKDEDDFDETDPSLFSEDWFPSLTDYSPGLSKDQWLELLNNKRIIGPVWGGVLAAFYAAGGSATCTEIAQKYNKTPFGISGNCTQLAKRIYKETACPLSVRENGTKRYWPILFQGKDAGSDVAGGFIWKLRPELFDALTEFNIMKFQWQTDDGVAISSEPKPVIWKISHGTQRTGISDNNKVLFRERNVVVVHGSTKAKGKDKTTQGDYFCHSITAGDYFYLCYGNSVQLFGRFTSDEATENDELKDGWYERHYQLIAEAISDEPYTGPQKWWAPNDNSTCIQVDDLELFEKVLLRPYFGMGLAQLTEPKGYWWLNANPKIWSFSQLKVGETQDYTLYNENGNKRRIFQNFLDAKEGDMIICYESTPVKQIVGICRIKSEQDGERILFEKVEGLSSPIDYAAIKDYPELEHMEYFQNPQGSLFKLTKSEYDFILDLIREENPVATEASIDAYTKRDFLDEVYMTEKRYENLVAVLRNKKNIILQGAPGVGKTFAARRLAWSMMGEKDDSRIEFVQFHQNYSYEDFMMGYKPVEDGFELKYGIFYRFCQKAANQPDKEFFFIIDEINRGNMSKIFGELLMLIEKDYRGTKATLAYNGLSFSVPNNLYIIGMMNTADRSLAMIDYALRRRFSFFEVEPGFDSEGFIHYQNSLNNETLNELVNKVKDLNREISLDKSLGKGFCIGHSYFCGRDVCTEEWLHSIVDYDILPMLSEYWFDDANKLQRWENILQGVFQ